MPCIQPTSPSDAELIRETRNGHSDAFATLWKRHRLAGIVAARSLAPELDADDLVNEAYARILDITRRGGGPSGAFRPYLYHVIRSVAVSWRRSPEQTNEVFDHVPAPDGSAPWSDVAFDSAAAARAFESLQPRWREVLWYTEIEGLAPRDAAPILGLTANGVSALAKRARKALRTAWAEAHIDVAGADASCRPVLKRLQRYHMGRLTVLAREKVAGHLEQCESCAKASDELTIRNRRLVLTAVAALAGVGSFLDMLDGQRSPEMSIAEAGVFAIGLVEYGQAALFRLGVLKREPERLVDPGRNPRRCKE